MWTCEPIAPSTARRVVYSVDDACLDRFVLGIAEEPRVEHLARALQLSAVARSLVSSGDGEVSPKDPGAEARVADIRIKFDGTTRREAGGRGGRSGHS